jgi:uncharacterized membrane protein HdeD (DUF308 family)
MLEEVKTMLEWVLVIGVILLALGLLMAAKIMPVIRGNAMIAIVVIVGLVMTVYGIYTV